MPAAAAGQGAGAVLDGVLERVTFANPETGYTIARIAPERGGADLVTAVGPLLGAQVGEFLRLRGRWTSHPRYGRQFEVHSYATVLPATAAGIQKYLGSGLIKGIGPVMAERMVAHFGVDIMHVIEAEPGRLIEVDGLGPKRTAMIAAAWAEQKAIKEVMIFLQGVGVSTSLAVRIYKKYGDASVSVVRDEPYRLAADVWGIGFKTADTIAAAVGIARDSPERIKAGLCYTLSEAADDGHCYLPAPNLIADAAKILDVPAELITPCLDELAAAEGVIREEVPAAAGAAPQVPAVYLPPFHQAERSLAHALLRLHASPRDRLSAFAAVDWDRALGWLTRRTGSQLAPEQADAVRLALTSRVAVLTGGPGCGKSFTVRSVVELARAKGATIVLAAPTGRAAKRLAELTGHEAATIHRLLALRPGGDPSFDASNPLDADLVVIDETSMVDVILANKLVKAVAPGAHLLLVGDVDQLPSVGAGEVLRDLLAAGSLPVVRLTKIFRQAAQSGIVVNAHRINAGSMPVFADFGDFFWFGCEDTEQTAPLVVDIVARRIPAKFGLDPRRDVQVLCPMHRGPAGAGNLNLLLQDALTPYAEDRPERRYGGRVFRVGDKVTQLRNNYDKGAAGVFNGTVGVVTGMSPEEHTLTVRTDEDESVDYGFDELDELAHAYAVTIHRSQGSEYPAVVVPLTTSAWMMLQRNLLYTGVTRARKLVVLVGSRRALAAAVRTKGAGRRHTALAHRLHPLPGRRKSTGVRPAVRPTIGRMPSYEPVDLSAVCNAGVEVLGDAPGDVPLGRVELRGLPFLIGPEPPAGERCFLLPTGPTSVGVGRLARHVIVAHRLLEPGAPAGHAVGQTVAEYAFHLAGGEVVTALIRERFEIQVVPPAWGRQPFLAVTDTSDYNLPRFAGSWGEAGYRLTEHAMGNPAGYYLWCWENPHPERPVERIELIPCGARFVVAGITTSDVDEHPFVRGPARPVRLVANDGQDGVLDIDVDRGVATYPQPLPGDDDRAGWGATEGKSVYASIAALPSATVAVRRGKAELGRVTWGDVERDGRAEADRVSVELVERGRNWVHVSVVDDATGRPVPCRVHFRSAEGIPYQPHGHHNHVAQNLGSWHYDVGGDIRLGQRTYAYIDGTCQGWLPRGEVIVDVARGFEYEPVRQTVRIERGQRDLTLRIGRAADMASEGWWSGDSHVHFLSTSGAQLEQRGEDLRVVNLLQSQWGALFTNTEDFSGRPSVVDGGGYVTYVGQENRQHALGHTLLWGLTEPVMPWCSDGPDEAELGGALDVTLSDWADRTHAQGGTVVAAHFPNPNGEPAVLIATGRADAVEMLFHSDDGMLEYYRYLNSGYRLPLVGGTDKMSSAVPVGLYRTYARLDEEFSYEAWCRAVRSGRTFLSGGPLVTLSVDGHEPGATVELSGPGTVSVHAAVRSIFPLRSLEVVRNGEVVARAEAGGGRQAEISEELRIDGHSWIACRAFGVDCHLDEWDRRVFAHTSPVYVACGGDWTMTDSEGIRYIRTLIEGAREYVRHTAVRRSDQLTTHHHGEANHLAWLERPFAEALRALEEHGR